jgi:hypothetical protein
MVQLRNSLLPRGNLICGGLINRSAYGTRLYAYNADYLSNSGRKDTTDATILQSWQMLEVGSGRNDIAVGGADLRG